MDDQALYHGFHVNSYNNVAIDLPVLLSEC